MVDAYVGGRLRLIRNAKCKSRAELARKLNVSLRKFTAMENGADRLSPENMWTLTQLFDIKASYFFEGMDGTSTH